MHPIVQRVGLRPRPHWGAHSARPDPLAGNVGGERRVRGGEGRKEESERERENLIRNCTAGIPEGL